MTGIRTNVEIENYSEVDRITKDVFDGLTRRGKIFLPYAEDYFFMTRDRCTLNWTAMADVVIGRPAYDNYVIAKAMDDGVNVIDTTRTLTALHLSKKNVPKTGLQNTDADFNREIIGKFDFTRGRTNRIKLETVSDIYGNIFISKKLILPLEFYRL